MININDINIDLKKKTAIPLCKNHLILITEHLTHHHYSGIKSHF